MISSPHLLSNMSSGFVRPFITWQSHTRNLCKLSALLSACWGRLSHFISERLCSVRRRKLHHYSVIEFLLSLSAFSELTEIKMFTSINLAEFAHVQTLMQTHACVISIGLKHFQHCDVTNGPAPRIENVPNCDTTVPYRTKRWIFWTVTPHIYTYIYTVHAHTYAHTFNILKYYTTDNVRTVYEHQISILTWFLKEHVTLKTGVVSDYSKFSFDITEINEILKRTI